MTLPASHLRSTPMLVLVLAFTAACGGGGDASSEQSESVFVAYDEAVNGPLPFALESVSASDLSKYTVEARHGIAIVRGTSDSGEAILLVVRSGLHIQAIDVDFNNHHQGNGLVVLVERFPYDGTSFIDLHPMPQQQRYLYSVPAPNSSYTAGNYAVRISTAVGGASPPNEFSLGVRVAR